MRISRPISSSAAKFRMRFAGCFMVRENNATGSPPKPEGGAEKNSKAQTPSTREDTSFEAGHCLGCTADRIKSANWIDVPENRLQKTEARPARGSVFCSTTII